jgi:hypothetical protein
VSASLDLTLPVPERRRAARLASPWNDLLYVPAPAFASDLEPGCYRSTIFVALRDGDLVRVSSLAVPAFGGELCRIRLEPVNAVRLEALGSFFEVHRQGLVFAFTSDRRAGAVWPPADPTWCYAGGSLHPRLALGGAVRLLRETGRCADGGTWTADRGLLVGGADGQAALVLATADEPDRVAFLPRLGVYAALVDPRGPDRPGASRRELLGYGDWDPPPAVDVELLDLSPADFAGG